MVQPLEQEASPTPESLVRLAWFETNRESLDDLLRKYGGQGRFVVVGSVKRGEAVPRSDLDLASLVPDGLDTYPDILAIRAIEDEHDLDLLGIRPDFFVNLIGVYHAEYDF